MTRRLVLVAIALVALHAVAAHVLDRGALVERMLSPGGDDARFAAAITIAFLLLRLGVLFVLPGWILARLVRARIRAARYRQTPIRHD